MSIYSDPPELLAFRFVKPTLLVCWWITAFCTTMILLRLAGRFIRTERLFREDKVAALALIPLYARMACVHVILLYGTNNARLAGVPLTQGDIDRKALASGLVLLSRIFHAATLWILKNTILEFFKRLTGVTWERSYDHTLLFIRCTLGATFLAVVISDLAECQPFPSYWQVLPDPGPKCRQGFAQLFTMAACNIITDLLLVFFPIPIIIRSHMSIKKKVQLTLLFSLSLSVVGVTLYKIPHVVWAHGNQQLRSLLASIELLFATTAANALVLGSFVRDRGVKKRKFKFGSIAADSMDRSSGSRRPTLHRHWGSDEDLVRDIGISVDPELREAPLSGFSVDGEHPHFTPAPLASRYSDHIQQWQFPQRQNSHTERSDDSYLSRDPLMSASSRSNSTATPRKVSFFDVGGLLSDEHAAGSVYRRDSHISNIDPLSTQAQSLPSPGLTAGSTGVRRGSTALLQDLGALPGLLSPKQQPRQKARNSGTELQTIPQSRSDNDSPSQNRTGAEEPELMDLGGLLK